MRRGSWAKDPLQRAAVALAVLSLVVLVLMLGKPSFSNASRPPVLGNAILSLQFARSVEDVDLILSEAPSPDREAMRIKTYLDFGFIAAYAAFGGALSMLRARPGGWRATAAIAAAVCTLGAAVFDFLENRAILELLDTPLRATTPGLLNGIRRPSLAKWALAGIAAVFLCSTFVPRREHEPLT
jgi:hypothetical protein